MSESSNKIANELCLNQIEQTQKLFGKISKNSLLRKNDTTDQF